ncbi:Fanconi anemia group I-like protein [Armadillidium nasatum]|uniref:Fanconi anemia group I-like protein n=1 Tax=Armadillidium nasatum TaxID=96803 RepID=A0A5N5TB90_9CRUS|nr:Fanconi anemia group I-like protein [Armadillidium nasatum]
MLVHSSSEYSCLSSRSTSLLRIPLILILRKMLFSREVESRRVAVQGFINILAQFRVMGALPSSQASFSFFFYIEPNNHNARANIIVRRTLYEGLSDVAKSNVKLVHNIMELLYQHLSTFIDIKEEILNPVKLHKTVTTQGESVVILEPLGELLLCLSKCKSFHDNRRTSRGMDDDEDDDFVTTLNGICSMFDSLVEKLAYCDLDDLNIGNISCSSAGARGKTNIMYVEVMIGVYDGLLHWVFCNDALQSPDKMKDLIALFKTQRKIIEANERET